MRVPGYPSRELTYLTVGKGESSTQNALKWGYVSSQQSMAHSLRTSLGPGP